MKPTGTNAVRGDLPSSTTTPFRTLLWLAISTTLIAALLLLHPYNTRDVDMSSYTIPTAGTFETEETGSDRRQRRRRQLGPLRGLAEDNIGTGVEGDDDDDMSEMQFGTSGENEVRGEEPLKSSRVAVVLMIAVLLAAVLSSLFKTWSKMKEGRNVQDVKGGDGNDDGKVGLPSETNDDFEDVRSESGSTGGFLGTDSKRRDSDGVVQGVELV